ncbi:complement factor B-like [Amblyraja radiata]|uniref:complement factor B-like n=1 Tax=Amblyraja radiata TaxID=386614 RepID=UPI0014024FBF|nr:complement factor B-like [Amblyraja radiata]
MRSLYLLGLVLPLLLTCKGEMDRDMPVTCDPGIHIVGGDVSKSHGDNVKSVATFNCPDGFYPSPVITTKCQRSGDWCYTSRYRQPICKEFRCPPPVLEEGFYSPVNTSYAIGDVVTLQCYEGYSLRGAVSRTCKMNGRWTGANTVCNSGSHDCPHPGIPAGGSKTGTNYNIGYKVRYYCNNGLVLMGSSTRECERLGEWSGRMPTCQHRSSFDTPDDVAEAFTASLTSTLGLTRTDSSKTPESHLRKIYVGKDAHLYIYFLIDASNSVGQVNFDQAINVVKNLTDKIASFDINPRFGVITYASGPEVIVTTNDDRSKNAAYVMDAMNSEQAKYGAHKDRRGTNIYAALRKVLELMSFSKVTHGADWKKIRFVTILFTDGKANMGGDPQKAVIQIEDFVNAGGKRVDYLDMYAFGITQGVELMDLNGLASKKPDETHAFLVKRTDDLVDAFNKY